MTERLAALLRDQAGGVAVPDPSPETILARGRRERRKRQGGMALVAAAAVAVVGGGWLVGGGLGDGDNVPDPAAGAGSDPVFAAGTTVFYGDGAETVEIADTAVKSIYYTSAGVLVRHGDNPFSDGGGPQRFSLITPDGTAKQLGLVTEETVHMTDADQPFVAYAENVDGRLEVVVYDVAADAEAARIDVGPTRASWFPVAIDSDTVWVQDAGTVRAVDWRTGEVTASDAVDSVWGLNDGHAASTVDGSPVVVDVRTDEVLLTGPPNGYFEVSPDGRYAGLVDEEGPEGEQVDEFVVYTIETGRSVTLDGNAFEWGWTPDGHLFRVGRDHVTTCSAETGECATTQVDIPALETVGGGETTTTELVPECMWEVPEMEPGETWQPGAACRKIDCADPAQRSECMEIESTTDESYQEEIVLGGQVRES